MQRLFHPLMTLVLLVSTRCGDEVNCVVDGTTCSDDCVEVRSARASELGINVDCLSEGVFLGCAPDPSTGFYDSEGGTGQAGICGYTRDRRDAVCFVGTVGLWWYYANQDQFCHSSIECGETPRCQL